MWWPFRKKKKTAPPVSSGVAPRPAPSAAQYYLEEEDCSFEAYLDKYPMTHCFRDSVMILMEQRNISPSTFYHRADLDRKLFSAIKNGGEEYQPSRNTAIRCCFALHLSPAQADVLMKQAGFALSDARLSDIIIRYCLENGYWNLVDVDELLNEYGEETLVQ